MKHKRKGLHIGFAALALALLLMSGLPSQARAQGNSTTVGTLSLFPAFENMGVISNYSGDDNGNNNATLEYREVGSSTWKPGISMTVDRRDEITYYPGSQHPDVTVPNQWARQWRAVIFGLEPDTEYEVRVTYTDPDSVNGTNPISRTVRTRDDNPPSNGNTYYVATTGSDETGDGSESNPWRTIQHAADLVVAGDRVLVAPGTYNEQVTVSNKLGTEDNYITFESVVEYAAIIDGQTTIDYSFLLQHSHYIRIKGFHLLNTRQNPIRAEASNYVIIEDNICEEGYWGGSHWARGGIYFKDNSHHITIQRNHISRTREHYETMGIMIQAEVDEFTGQEGGNVIRYNTITGSFRDSISRAGDYLCGGLVANSFVYGNTIYDIPDDDGLEIEGPDVNVAVFENTIYNVHHMAVGLAPVSVGPLYVFRNVLYNCDDAILKLGSSSHGYLYVYHNTMYTKQYGQGPSMFGSNSKAYNQTYRNNIIQTARPALYYRAQAGNSTNDLDYDCWLSGSTTQKFRWGDDGGPSGDGKYPDFEDFQAYTGQEPNGIYGDALFVDPENGNFHLQPTSPCINKGLILPGFNDANSPWPYQGSAPDMGAFEFASGPPSPPGPLHHITVRPAGVSLNIGQTQQFTATGYDQNDNEVTGLSFTWSVVNPDAGTIDSSGLFTAGTVAGTYPSIVKAEADSVAGSALVTVNPGPPLPPGPLHHITITPASVSLEIGQTQQFTAIGYDQNDNYVPITPSWSTDVGSIDDNGLFTAQSTPDVSGYVKAEADSVASYAFVTVTAPQGPEDDGGDGEGEAESEPNPNLKLEIMGLVLSVPVTKEGVLEETVEASSPDGAVTLRFAEGTQVLDSEGNPLDRITVYAVSNAPGLPGGAHMIWLAYDFGPEGTTFDPEIELMMRYYPVLLPVEVSEEDLVIAYYNSDSEQWVSLSSVVDTEAHTVSVWVSHFTIFAIVRREEAAFHFANFSISPTTVDRGESVDITVEVTNTGGVEESCTITLLIDDVEEATQELTLGPGATDTVTFTVTGDKAGTHEVTVGGLSDSFTVTAPSFPWVLFGGVLGGVLAALAAGVALYLVVLRPRGSDPQRIDYLRRKVRDVIVRVLNRRKRL